MPSVRVQDQDLFYAWNPAVAETAPTAVLIHGLGSSHAFYAPIVQSLVDGGISCLSLDTPGSALSKYAGKNRDVPALASIVKDLLSALKIEPERCAVVGHSMGALVASELSLQTRLLGTVLIGPVQPSSAVAEVFSKRIQTVQNDGVEPLANTIPSAATGSKSTSTQRAFIRSLILSQTPEGYVSLCRTIAGADGSSYGTNTSPLLLIAGSDDKTAPLEASRQIYDGWLGGSKTLQVLDGVGHWHCIEAADQVSASISTFVHELAQVEI